ncbi:Metallo-dependent phosphatase [Ascodesmis nigricans]|uniref:Metallo-dependent phosphatase n=1 Tax=Ascodesmis nigricans TaxID=341454 RepID=A0A4V3SHJ0_9PEZI|nr:Metallo-dependent phosphatase [Ascodesmis nigricans]
MDVSTSHLLRACAISTIIIRLTSYLFFRWIPGHHFPPLVFTAFFIYVTVFGILKLSKTPESEVQATTSTVTVVTEESDEDVGDKQASVKQIEAIETVVYERQPPHPLRTLLLGIPSARNWKITWLSFLINALLTLGTWDLTFRSHYFYPSHDVSFARVGYVGPSSAKVLVREPREELWPVSVWYAPNEPISKTTSLAASIETLSDETDYTATVTLPRLSPETEYRWFTSSNHTGTFTTAPSPNHAPKNGEFTFLHTSCIKPRFPYNPLHHPLSIRGFQLLSAKLDDLKASFMLFLGDWIYIDVPRRYGKSTENYREHYRQMYASPDWGSVGDHLPWLHVLDDHEIANDWDKGTSGVYQSAINPFNLYHHALNPPSAVRNETYYTFDWGSAASFFMLDTRTFRSPAKHPDGPTKTMLGIEQRAALLNWLAAKNTDWKFIISSVPFTKNWHYASANDTWAAYLWERQLILDVAWKHPGVVVLSGDRHEFAATKFPPRPVAAPAAEQKNVKLGQLHKERYARMSGSGNGEELYDVWEFSCSPLNMFYLPIRTYKQTDEEDVAVKYVPDGNVKWGSVTVETGVKEQAVLKYRLWVDGEERWSVVVTQPRRRRG